MADRTVYINAATGSASPTDPTSSGDPYDSWLNAEAGEASETPGSGFTHKFICDDLVDEGASSVVWNATDTTCTLRFEASSGNEARAQNQGAGLLSANTLYTFFPIHPDVELIQLRMDNDAGSGNRRSIYKGTCASLVLDGVYVGSELYIGVKTASDVVTVSNSIINPRAYGNAMGFENNGNSVTINMWNVGIVSGTIVGTAGGGNNINMQNVWSDATDAFSSTTTVDANYCIFTESGVISGDIDTGANNTDGVVLDSNDYDASYLPVAGGEFDGTGIGTTDGDTPAADALGNSRGSATCEVGPFDLLSLVPIMSTAGRGRFM